MKPRTMGRVVAVIDEYVYCVFPILGYDIAIRLPRELVGEKAGVDFRFHVRLKVPDDFRAHTHEELELSDFELDSPQVPKKPTTPEWLSQALNEGDGTYKP